MFLLLLRDTPSAQRDAPRGQIIFLSTENGVELLTNHRQRRLFNEEINYEDKMKVSCNSSVISPKHAMNQVAISSFTSLTPIFLHSYGPSRMAAAQMVTS